MSKGQQSSLALDLLSTLTTSIAEAKKREDERRAKLSPAARAAEDAVRDRATKEQARAVEAVRSRKIVERMERVAAPFRRHRSFTITEFACLLHGVKLADFKTADWFFFQEPDVTAAQQSAKIIASAVCTTHEAQPGFPLFPVNATEPQTSWRFSVESLLRLASAERLGHYRELSASFKTGQQTIAPESASASDGRAPSTASNATPSPSSATRNNRSKGVPAKESDAASDWRQVLDDIVGKMLAEAEAVAGRKLAKTALPFTQSDIFDRFTAFYEQHGQTPPRGSTTIRKHVNDRGYKCADGVRDQDAGKVRRALRKP